MCELPCELSDLESDDDEEDSDDKDESDGGLLSWLQDTAQWIVDQGRNVAYSAMADFIEWHASQPEDAAKYAVTRLTDGPKRGDSVAIVGAGPAGTHMAYLLKLAGCRVFVFEKSSRIGGKSLSVLHRSAWHEMGTCYMTPDYQEVQRLLNDFDANEQVSTGSRNVWDPDNPGRKCSFRSWIFAELRNALGNQRLSRPYVAVTMFRQVITYTDLHRRLLGSYKGFLMPRPSDAALQELNCSIEEFLDRHQLQALKPIFFVTTTLQGYGYLHKTSALYGLLWVTPTLLASVLEYMKLRKHLPQEPGSLRTRPTGAYRSVTTLVKGFQRLWENIIDRVGIHVERNAHITDICRSDADVKITYRKGDSGKHQRLTFNFLVLAVAPHEISPVLDVRDDEQRIMSKVETSTFITTLFDYKPSREEGMAPIDNWFSNVQCNRELSVWAARDTHHLLRHTSFKVKLDNPEMGTAVAYQFADHPLNEEDKARARDEHRVHFEKHGFQDITVVQQEAWSYFPHHTQLALSDGVLWNILQLQGCYRTWYTGSWTCFESINAIVFYNKMLTEVWSKQLKELEEAEKSNAAAKAKG